MLRLTKHFIENWRERVGGEPDPDLVNRIIQEAVRVQKGKRAVGRFAVIKNLSVYCHFTIGVVITVDHYRENVVSVYSEKNMPAHVRLNKRRNPA